MQMTLKTPTFKYTGCLQRKMWQGPNTPFRVVLLYEDSELSITFELFTTLQVLDN